MGTQHENLRAAMFVNENSVDSRSDVDDLRTRDCLYGESRPVGLYRLGTKVVADRITEK